MTDHEVMSSAFSRFFTDQATAVDFHEDSLVLCNDLDAVVLVELGELDLFAVQLVDGRPHGRWTFLSRVRAGSMVLGWPGGPKHAIVGRPTRRTYVSRMPLQGLQELSARQVTADTMRAERVRQIGAPEFAVAVDQFVRGLDTELTSLSAALRADLPPRDFLPLDPLEPTTTADDGVAVRPLGGIQWVQVQSGSVQLGEGGAAGKFGAGKMICMSERDWLVADGQAVLRSWSTMDMLQDGRLWAALLDHTNFFLYAVDRRIEARQHAEQSIVAGRDELGDEVMARAMSGFASVLIAEHAGVGLADVVADPPALAAVRLVAGRHGIPVTSPHVGEETGRRLDPVTRIALISGIRTRSVRLPGTWWKQDLGPMIGYRRSDEPVALLPARKGYVMALPDQARLVPVDAELAETMLPQATTLYRPLPVGTRSPASLLWFGLREGGRDLRTLLTTALLVGLVGLVVPILTGAVLGTFVPRAERDLIVQGALLVVGAAFVVGALSVVQNIAVLRLEGRVDSTVQAAVWDRLLSLPVTFHSRFSTGQLATMSLGVNAIREQLSSVTTTAALGAMVGLLNLVLIFFYSVPLALLATALVAVSLGVCWVSARYGVRRARELYRLEQRLSGTVFQLLTGMSKLRVAAAEERAFAQWSGEFARGRSLLIRLRRLQNGVTTFNAGFPIVGLIAIFALVAGPLRADVSLAAFLSFFVAFSLLLNSILALTAAVMTTLGVIPRLEGLDPILAADPEVSGDKLDPGSLSGAIRVNHVSFRYHDDGPLVLDDVTLHVNPGEFVAIVGPTGCGKSTLLRLLLGFADPTSGSVLYDGQDLCGLDVRAIRRQCGVVLQNGSLLAGDIATNIIGGGNYTTEDAWMAARMADIDEDIAAMPMGMNTVLSEGASTLSGGQRQRLMIARALVSKPRILFLDEATSALDNAAQQEVANSTRRLSATRVVIAHRLSTIAGASRIIVLDRGRVVQQGSYEELLDDPAGMFARLVRRQMLGPNTETPTP